MAGYIIYSLDWSKFTALVERPTPAQLSILARHLADEREGLEDEFDEDDPILRWPTAAKSLVPIVADRLARADWYGDLSRVGQELWEMTICGACMNSRKLGVGFRVDSDGVYWDVINLISEQLGDRPESPGKSAMSRFGTVPFRSHPPAQRWSTDWTPMHSMHPPAEVQRMLAELRAVAPAVEAARDTDIRQQFGELLLPSLHRSTLQRRAADVRQQFTEELLPAVERVAADGRLLFIQVDT